MTQATIHTIPTSTGYDVEWMKLNPQATGFQAWMQKNRPYLTEDSRTIFVDRIYPWMDWSLHRNGDVIAHLTDAELQAILN